MWVQKKHNFNPGTKPPGVYLAGREKGGEMVSVTVKKYE